MMTNYNIKTYFVIILLVCIGFVNLSIKNENFDTIKTPTEYKSTQEIKNQCDSESKDFCNDCKNAYDNYNLYPSSNSFVVRGNDINMDFKNNINDSIVLSDMGTKNYQVLNNIIKDYNPHNDESTKSAFDDVLKNAPLKTGCCFRTKNDEKERNVLVRIPLNPNENVDPLLKKFDFKFKSLKIPENSCPINYYGGSNDCNTFFDVYCKNLLNEFTKLNLPIDNFTKFAPECSCYAPNSNVENIYPPTTPPACYKTNCDNIIDPIAYIDPISRNNSCDLTICNNIFNANNITAGGNVNISAKMESVCGNNLPNKNIIDNNDNSSGGISNESDKGDKGDKGGGNGSGNGNEGKKSNNINITTIIIIITVLIFIMSSSSLIYNIVKN